MTKITVIDSLMGSGKTSWAIQSMNGFRKRNYMYITPFLTEVDRIKTSVKFPMKSPSYKGGTKEDDLCALIQRQEDIASTHALFRNLSKDTMRLIEESNYVLYLDEVLDVLEPLNIKKDTVRVLKEADCISIDEDGYVNWNMSKIDYDLDQMLQGIKQFALEHRLLCVNNQFLLWQVPPELFTLFKEVYILTYKFDASILFYYFNLYGIECEYKSVEKRNNKYELVEFYEPDASQFSNLIEIYEGKMNDNIFQKDTSFSKSWFGSSKSKEDIKTLKKNLYNYFRNIHKVKSDDIMWSTFKEAARKIDGAGFKYKDLEKYPELKDKMTFVPCNSRATNDYADRHCLAYCLNIYLHPGIVSFFEQKGIGVDEDSYALSILIQWIWRSAIRNGERVSIYIPSDRMRSLLKQWISNSFNPHTK